MRNPNARRRRADAAAIATRLFAVEGGHSGNDEWGTPHGVFAPLDAEFGFTLDVSAQPYNTKCTEYFGPEQDGLKQPWTGVVWCNPPYSQVAHWVAKARDEVARPGGPSLVAALLPVWADQDWWHDHIVTSTPPLAELRWFRGRVKFVGRPGTAGRRPMFASVLAIYRRPA